MKSSVQSISLSKLKNELHSQLNDNVDMLITKTGVETLQLGSLYPLYKKALQGESIALNYITKSPLTPIIDSQDTIRDSLYRGLSHVVKGLTFHFVPEISRQANQLWSIIEFYGDIIHRPVDEETAAIKDLLRELTSEANNTALAALNLTEWTGKLAEENNKLEALVMDRDSETAIKRQHRMKVARAETDIYFRAIVAHIKSLLLVSPTPEITAFVNDFNVTVARYNSRTK